MLTPIDVTSLGRALLVVGDQWSMLIIREAFGKVGRFSEFKKRLDLSDAVLSRRLTDLVDAGVFETLRYSDRPPRDEYRLTEQGRALWAVFVAIWVWESRWVRADGGRLAELVHDTCGRSISPIFGCGACGAVGVTHRQTRAIQRPDTTFNQSNPARRYRRSGVRADGRSTHLHPLLLDLLGDRWTVSVLGGALLGLRRFGEFQDVLGISPFLLSERLAAFVDDGVMTKVPIADGGRRQHYRLLPKGLDMMPVFATANDWGNRWYPDPAGPGLTILHESCGNPFVATWFCNACGDALTRKTIHYTQ